MRVCSGNIRIIKRGGSLLPAILFATAMMLSQATTAQTRSVDSLKTKLATASSEEQRLDLLLALCEFHHSINRDSLDQWSRTAMLLAMDAHSRTKVALAAVAVGNAYLKWGWTDSAAAAVEPQLAMMRVSNDDERPVYFKLSRVKALCFGLRSKYQPALTTLYKIIGQAEQYNDSIVLGANYNTIGSIAVARNYAHEALNWFTRALAVSPNRVPYIENRAAIYTNMANAYNILDKQDSALLLIEKAIPLSTRAENLNILATGFRIKSNILMNKGQVKEAEAALQEMLAVRNKTTQALNDVEDNLVLIDFYIKSNQIDKAIKACLERLQRGNVTMAIAGPGTTFSNDINVRLNYYEVLARCYKLAGRKDEYRQTLETIIAAKDSIASINSATAIAEVQQRYEVQKKENTIIQQNLHLTRQQLDITRKNYLFYGSLLLTLCAGVIAWQIFRNYRRKQLLKLQLMQQEEKQLALAAVKDAEENERKRIAADLHDSLGAYAASIASNLDYISTLPGDDQNKTALRELRDNSRAIVAQLSDTIWALNKESLSLTALSDRLKVFLQRVARSYPDWELDVLEKIKTDFSLPPSQAFHLLQIAQEAIINAVRHSAGKKVSVLVSSNSNWVITICDDGKGMKQDVNVKKEGGNGLMNMNRRAMESGWLVRWEQNHPAGTCVIITPDAKVE